MALVHFKPILRGMVKAGVPESWLTFAIGTLKTAGAVGLLLGVIGVPLIGTAAAVGLILFFVCANVTHIAELERENTVLPQWKPGVAPWTTNSSQGASRCLPPTSL